MANPQSENGHTRIANELMDALARTRIPGEARQVLDFIFRKTYGFHKKSDRISTSQFIAGTGLPARAIERARYKLREMNMIVTPVKNDGGQVLEYRINKDYDTWRPPTKMTAPPRQKRVHPPSKMTVEPPSKMTGNKNNKSNYTKTKRQPEAGLRPVCSVEKAELKDLLDQVYRSGFNIYKLINKFKKEARKAKLLMFGEKYDIPEEVLTSVCKSYLKNKQGIKGEHFPWVLAALGKAATEWWVAKQDKEHQERKADNQTNRGGMSTIQDVINNMLPNERKEGR